MSLLEDFETLAQKQDNSIEYFLLQMVMKDRYPIEIGLDEFSREYFEYFNSPGDWMDSDRPLYRRGSTLRENRVYLASGIVGPNVSQLVSERMYILGCLEIGFRKITREELHKYIDIYAKQWPDSELSIGSRRPRGYSYSTDYMDIEDWTVNSSIYSI